MKMKKFEMAYQMDRDNYRQIPWLHIYDVLSKREIQEEYKKFLVWKINN